MGFVDRPAPPRAGSDLTAEQRAERQAAFEDYYLRTRGVPVDWDGDPALDPMHKEAARRADYLEPA